MQETSIRPLDKILLFIVRYGLFFVFIIPFIVVLSYLYPWVSGKIWGFELMVEILLPFWIILAFRRKEYRPATNAFLYALIAYFAIATISMIVGDMPHRSMWSKPDRLTGMFFQYHLFVFFLMASTVWRGMITKVAATSLTAATIAALWGFGQVYLHMAGADGGRGQASLGNADYLGQYLVPHVFLAGWLLWRNRANGWRILYGLSIVALMLGIFSTKSRGALVGIFIALLVGSVIGVFKGQGKLRKVSWIGIVALIALVGLFFLANKWRPSAAWLYDNRMAIQYFQETTGPRKLLIVNALKSIKARPLLGWGPENFESPFYYYYDPTTIRFSDYETRQDRPHNLILEMLVDVGIIGFLAYVAIFWFAGRLVLRSEFDNFEASLLVMVVIGHLATNLFIFETPVSYINLFFLLSVLATVVAPKLQPGEDDLTAAGVPAGVVAGGIILWIMSYAIIASIRAGGITSQAIVGLSSGRITIDQLMPLIGQIKEIKTPEQERYVRAIVSNLSSNRSEYSDGPLKPALVDLAAFEYGQSASQQHDFVNGLVTGTAVASIWPRTPEQQAALEEAAARVQRLAPNRQEVFWLLGQIATEKGDLKGAEADYQHGMDLDPAAVVPKAYFAAFLIRTNQMDHAMAYLKDNWPTIRKNDEASYPVSRAVISLLDRKNDDGLIELYNQAKSQDALTFEWAVAGTLGAIEKGDFKTAHAMIDETKALFPAQASLVDQYVVPQLEQAEQAAGSVKK